MADIAGKGRDNGRIGFAPIDAGMNQLPPKNTYTSKTERLGYDDGENSKDQEIIERLRKRMNRAIDWEAENRKAAVVALKFKAGEQWPADVAAQRNVDKRPCLTINRLPTVIRQVTNDQRMNRPSINVSPVGDKGDPEAAKMYRGLIRAIERHSSADIAYDTAFESAVSNGFGYFRLCTEYETEDSFNQTIMIKRIRNPFTVYLDPDHQEPDGADCRYGFVTEMIPEDEFKELYPDAQVVPFDLGGQGEKFKNWSTKDGVRVVEYFEVCEEKRTLVELDNGHIGWEDELHDLVTQRIKSGSIKVLDKRESSERKVNWYKATVLEILERGEWLGKWIPLIPVMGNEIDIEGKVKLSGLIDAAMDSQRMFNYYRTKETEAVALAPLAPFIAEEGQIEGHEDEWRTANTTANPVLQYKAVSVGGHPAPPPQRQPLVGIPEGFVNGAQSAAMDIMATTGIRFDVAADKRSVDERSGKALREFNRPQDLGASHYMDNLGRALKFCGMQLLDLIPKIYDERRVITILREDDSEEQVEINPHAPKPAMERQEGNKKLKIFNPTTGRYGVTITIGPSYATRRIEAADSMLEFAKAMPNTANLIADLIAKNMDWDGAEEMATRLAKAVPPQLLTPEQKDVPPQMQAYIQSLEGQVKQMGQQLQQAMAAINDKQADRAIAQDKIDKDFEAKILGVMEKAEANRMKVMAEQVRTFMDALKPEPEPAKPAKKPNA